MDIPTLQPGCPWYTLSTWALPNVKWCEASQCGWITEPANTWSNLAYLVVGLALLARASLTGNRLMRLFGLTQLAVGLASFIYHASYTFVFQVLDFAGMYLFCVLLLVFNLRRLGVLSAGTQWRAYGLGVGVLSVITPVLALFRFPIQVLVGLLVLALLATEARLYARATSPTRYGPLLLSLALLAGAATFSALDVSRVLCDPEDHVFQGHALWHVLSALALGCSYKFYEPFAPLLLPSRASPGVELVG